MPKLTFFTYGHPELSLLADAGRPEVAEENESFGLATLTLNTDVNGWQTDQFMGRGEFYLNFGNYDVKLTVPWNHIVDATGELQNPDEVLTVTQQQRLAQPGGTSS